MKSPYVSELRVNQVVTANFLVQNKEIRQKRTGEPYLSLTLADRTGEVEAKMWDNAAEVMDTFEREDFLKVRGLLQVHHNRLQLTIHKLQRQPSESVDFTDYYPASQRDPEDMFRELLAIAASLSNPHLKALLEAILADDEIARRLKVAPAAKNVHHAYLGGLIEHVLSMCTVAKMLVAHYRLDADLVLAGIILHDIGKIHELTYDRSFSYSAEGQLIGHINIGLRLMEEKLRGIPDFPVRLRTLLEHVILSHHGQLEYGSPKAPMFPEALLVHLIDTLDSKVECMRAHLHKDRLLEGCWTGYIPAIDRSVLKKDKYLDGADTTPASTAAAASAMPSAAPGPRSTTPIPPPSRASSAFAEKLQGALKTDS